MAINFDDGGRFRTNDVALDEEQKAMSAAWGRDWSLGDIMPHDWACTIVGARGTGKTTMAARMTASRALSQVARRGLDAVLRAGFWIEGARLAELAYEAEEYGNRDDFQRYMRRAKECRYLVFDDLSAIGAAGSPRKVELGYGAASTIIQHRYVRGWTLATSATSPENLADVMPTAASRLAEGLIVFTDGVDRRSS
jgi:DNA replication protein DnaC